MSSEVCPFCGKSFKRLKTHLPHCKAAPNSKTPQSKHDAFKSSTSSSSSPPLTAVAQTEMGKKVAVSSSEPLLTSSPSTKKKKKKLKSVDQLETTTSLLPPSPPSNPKVPKPKKKSLRDLIEAAKSNQVTEGASENPLLFSPLRPRTSPQTETEPDKESLQFNSADTKRKDAPKKKASKPKKASQFVESKVDECNTRPRTRDKFWVNEEEMEDLTVTLNSGGGPQVGITLQNVKATLGRANSTRQPGSADSLSSRIRRDAGEQNDAVKPAALWDQLQPVRNKDPKSEQPRSIQLQRDTPPRPHTGSPVGPPPSKVGRHVAGLLATSPALGQFSSPLRFPLPPQSPPVRAETLQLEALKQNTAEKPTEAAVMQRSLGQVRLRELPEWLACRTPSHPREVVEMLQRGWRWYYRRYIDVRKGGVAGVGMLLAGYCALSYIWTYPHTKLDRWRKYH